jgi:hypothetical protein
LPEKSRIPVTPSDQEADVLFRVQMKVADIVLGYWKQGLGVLGVVLLASLVVGLTQGWIRDSRRSASAAIARVTEGIPAPDPLSAYGLAPQDDLNDPSRVASLRESAEAFEKVAREASGVGRATAWIKAGELWIRVNDPNRALEAFRAARKASDDDILGYTAGSQVARILADQGDTAGARTMLRELATSGKGLLGERPLMEIMKLQLEERDAEGVKKSAAEFRARFAKSPRLDEVAALEARAAALGS